MSDPVKIVFDDGTEMPYIRCPHCKCPRSPDYQCSGCEAERYRQAAREVEADMGRLAGTLMKWKR